MGQQPHEGLNRTYNQLIEETPLKEELVCLRLGVITKDALDLGGFRKLVCCSFTCSGYQADGGCVRN